MWRRAIGLGLAAAMLAGSAQAGFKAAQWGMTPEQVEAALPGEVKAKKGGRLNGMVARHGGAHVGGGLKAKADFYYGDRGLGLVMLRYKRADCQAVLKDLVAAHGQPMLVSDQIMFKLLIWHDAAADNRLRLMVSSADICDLHVERLDDYRAIDEANAKTGT